MSYPQAMALMERGRANPSDYRIILPRNVTRFAPAEDANEYISFFCRAATLPSPSNSIMQLRGQERVGIARNVITGRNYGSPAVFTFTERSDLLIYTMLKGWMDSTVLNSEDTGVNSALRVQYYDASTCEIEVQKLEPQYPMRGGEEPSYRGHRLTGRWILKKAIPLSIEQTTLAIESADSALDFTISIAFESFEYIKENNPPLFGPTSVEPQFTS